MFPIAAPGRIPLHRLFKAFRRAAIHPPLGRTSMRDLLGAITRALLAGRFAVVCGTAHAADRSRMRNVRPAEATCR